MKMTTTTVELNGEGEEGKTFVEITEPEKTQKMAQESNKPTCGLKYSLDSTPPWYLCFMFGFQHYLTMFGPSLALPMIVTPVLCVTDNVVKAEIVGTIFFVSGIVTFIQTSVGIRLPIVQGGSFCMMGPIFALMSLPKWKCPVGEGASYFPGNATSDPLFNSSATGSDHTDSEIWKSRMREVQGALIVSSVLQIVLGLSGLLGVIVRFIGPLTISTTITLIGISLFEPAARMCSQQWGVACLTILLVTLFSQYLSEVKIPYYRDCCRSKRKATWAKYPLFSHFPIVLAILATWLICITLTYTETISNDPSAIGYGARTDIKIDVLQDTSWIRFPYPGQWGMPTVSLVGVVGMLAGVVAGMLESIGDYYACARLSGAPPPPDHAVNRGMMIEGFGCMLSGFWGTANGTSSYSENVGVIGITKVASRRVVLSGALIMIVFGIFGKVGALFVTIPDPIVGGIFLVMIGMIISVGVSNLQHVDLNSSRNLYIFGVSTFFGFTVSTWISKNPDVIQTGQEDLNQIILVLLKTNMFIGSIVAFFLDNTVPGTAKERGLHSMAEKSEPGENSEIQPTRSSIHTYDIPLVTAKLRNRRWASYIPVSPTFKGWFRRKEANLETEELINHAPAAAPV